MRSGGFPKIYFPGGAAHYEGRGEYSSNTMRVVNLREEDKDDGPPGDFLEMVAIVRQDADGPPERSEFCNVPKLQV